ncbi:hypothetical protein PG996_005577 [Apiospora saccharicola]|uniref:Uncharacterized protein n=1 Tax=Apiospora saccharicola TaxID=335842 RepID=A0ABR1VQP4_9PEZI
MATFASNGNFATSVMNTAFSLASTSSSSTQNFGLARPSYYHNPLFQQGTEDFDDDEFDVDFQDDFTIISNKDETLDSVDSLAQSLSSLHISTQRSSGDCSSKTTPKSILKKPAGTNDHNKPKKAVVWHTELAHDITNGEPVPQTQLPRELWYPMQVFKADNETKKEILDLIRGSDMNANGWVDISDSNNL